ncbi:Protein Dr1 [Heterocephalus glaber]|uniref:Protein Dr1 n=1 Tax=Heterocephalus glaber TaxID=10181 RepID=G5B6F1_HETGA|nr:Protein Dr1 [Heterocephalus glaber]
MASSSGNDDDLTIPRAAINKMMEETLPNVWVADDAPELVVHCCTEFIHLISSEANEIHRKSEKKVISPEHAIPALQQELFAKARQQQAELAQQERLQMQQATQQAQLAAASASATNQAGSSQDEEEDDDDI